MLFSQLLEMWLLEKKPYIKESTYAYYSFEITSYIMPLLGNLPLEFVTEERIQNAVLFWQNSGMQNQIPLKKSTVQNLVMLIKQVLKYAAKKKYLSEYYIDIHFVPQRNMKKEKVFNIVQQHQLSQALLENLSFRTFGILLCLNSGLRIGELCALKWSDIDITNGIFHVTKTLQRIYLKDANPNSQIIITPPKTSASIRAIPLSTKICNIIFELGELNPNGYILTNTEQYIEPRTLRRFYTNFLIEHDLPCLHFHCLRHTFATRCIEAGADYKTVSEILGHTTVSTTLNMYVHPPIEEKRKCVNLLTW